MKKKIISVASSILVLMCLSMAFVSCSTQGPEGPAGKDGLNGKNGVNGKNGKDGAANIVCITATSSSSDWTWFSSVNRWVSSMPIQQLTQSIVDNGVVLVYVKNSSSYNQLPYSLWLPDESAHVTEFSYSKGYINLHEYYTDAYKGSNPGVQTFKIVLIPPSSTAALKQANVSDLNSVVSVLGLDN